MPKYTADEGDRLDLQMKLERLPDLDHLRVRRYGDLLILESGPNDDAVRHARLRHVTVQYWRLEIASHTGRWEPTPIRGTMEDVLAILLSEFSWVIENPERTWEAGY